MAPHSPESQTSLVHGLFPRVLRVLVCSDHVPTSQALRTLSLWRPLKSTLQWEQLLFCLVLVDELQCHPCIRPKECPCGPMIDFEGGGGYNHN